MIMHVCIACICNTFVIIHQVPMQAIFICHLYEHIFHETAVESSSFVWVICRVSLVMLCKIFGSLWAWMLKVSTAACAVTQHKYSISSSPIMTSTRGSAHIVICLSGIIHRAFKKCSLFLWQSQLGKSVTCRNLAHGH